MCWSSVVLLLILLIGIGKLENNILPCEISPSVLPPFSPSILPLVGGCWAIQAFKLFNGDLFRQQRV